MHTKNIILLLTFSRKSLNNDLNRFLKIDNLPAERELTFVQPKNLSNLSINKSGCFRYFISSCEFQGSSNRMTQYLTCIVNLWLKQDNYFDDSLWQSLSSLSFEKLVCSYISFGIRANPGLKDFALFLRYRLTKCDYIILMFFPLHWNVHYPHDAKFLHEAIFFTHP